MARLFILGGPLMFILFIIAMILVVVTLLNIWRLARRRLPTGRPGDNSLQALPFWGVVAVLIGFLGQVSGHYKMLSVLVHAPKINPAAVAQGLRESLITTIFGLLICIAALLCWGALRWWQRINEARDA